MATLVSIGTGDFTTAGTWGVCNATAELDSEAGSTATTTSYVASSVFQPGAVTVSAIAVKLSSRTASPAGTFLVELYNSTLGASVAGTEVTIDASDLQNYQTPTGGLGWHVFKFGTPVLLLAATNYTVRVRSTSAGTVTVYRNGTAANWSRQLITTTTAAPAAGDKCIIAGEFVDTTTFNTFVVTMNNTAATIFGSVCVCNGGTLTWGTTAATAYLMNTVGSVLDAARRGIEIYAGGTMTMGTSGTPMPSDSSAIINFDISTNVDIGLEVRAGGTFHAFGASKTTRAMLAADVNVAATSMTSDVSTGWKSGDEIGIASTTRTAADTELKTMSGDATGTSIPIAALAAAHSGTGEIAGELINVTRNVKIRGESATLQGYINVGARGIFLAEYVEFKWLGSNTALKRGINFLNHASGECEMRHCSLQNFIVAGSSGIFIGSTPINTVFVFEDIVTYNVVSAFTNTAGSVGATSIDGWWSLAGSTPFMFNDVALVVNDIRAAGCTSTGITIAESAGLIGTFTNLVAHSGSGLGFSIGSLSYTGTLTNLKAWRNASTGISITGGQSITFDTVTCFGNATANILAGGPGEYTISNFDLRAGTVLTCPIGLSFLSVAYTRVKLETGTFGGSTQTHATADINVATGSLVNIVAYEIVFNSATNINWGVSIFVDSRITCFAYNGTPGDHRGWRTNGHTISPSIRTDTTRFHTASPSVALYPGVAARKLSSDPLYVPVRSGETATISVYTRKSVVGDGVAYNGNEPRLIVRKNLLAGILSNTVLDTHAVAAGSWEQLSGTTSTVSADCVLEVFVDCDGTAGWVNIDDWECATAGNSEGTAFWGNIGAFATPYNLSSPALINSTGLVG